jgi:hypothetical protein
MIKLISTVEISFFTFAENFVASGYKNIITAKAAG